MMIDQLFMRQWVKHHDEFTKDVQRTVGKLARAARDTAKRHFGMNRAYDETDPAAVPAAQPLLAGLAASALTLSLFVGAWAVSVPMLTYA